MIIESILSVDDSEADPYLSRRIVETSVPEAAFASAYDGREALEKLEDPAFIPTVILLDINMPGMNGFEFLDRYERTHGSEVSPVVVMLTSSMQTRDRERAQAYSVVPSYIEKPLPRDWTKEVRDALG